MSKVYAVMAREIRTTVLTKAFLIGVIGVPILIVGIFAVMFVMIATHEEEALVGTVAVVDESGEITEAISGAFDELAESSDGGAAAMARELTGADPEQAADRALDLATGAGADPSQIFGRGDIRITVDGHAADPTGDVPEDLQSAVGRGDLLAIAMIPPGLAEPSAAEPATGTEESGPADATAPGGDAGDTGDTGDEGDTGAADEPASEAPPRTWRLIAAEGLDADHIDQIERTIGTAIVDLRLERAGLDPEAISALQARPRLETDRVGEDGEARREAKWVREVRSRFIPMFFMMLLWISTFSSGTQLLHSTIEEKSNRVMEVLLSACSPIQLLAGKILGQGVVGLIFVSVYLGLGLAALAKFASLGLITPMQLGAFLACFVMAYFMVATMMAAIGSAVSDLRDANSLLTPVMLVLMVPMMLWMPISQAPNGAVATVMSFVPPAAPFVMILRLASEEAVPLWQVIVGISWGYFCMLAMVWAASRIFRVGVLMTGKPPSPLELIRWIRYA